MPPGIRKETTTMRFMMLIKSNAKAEAGVPPDDQLLSAMGKYNEELSQAGILLAADGLKASSKGARVRMANEKITVIDGPFAETKELVAGFWIIRVSSKAEAIEWAKKVPGAEGEIEVRQVYELSDFPVDPSEQPEGWRAQEQRFRDDTDPRAANPVVPLRQPGTKRFMIIHKGNPASEAGALPGSKSLEQMGALIQEQIEAGVLLAGEGLQPSSKGARVKASGTKRTIVDGPFAETKELVAGFSIVQLKTKADAIAFAKRCVVVLPPGVTENELEVRECFDPPPACAALRRKGEISDNSL
jgi:hypothetical protein